MQVPTRRLSYYNGQSYTFTWEDGNQLKSATVGGKTIDFYYNSDGIRTKKETPDANYYYRLSGSKVVEMAKENENGTVRYVFIYDAEGRPHELHYYSGYDDTTPTKYYYVLNLQGDVIQLRDSSNAVVANYTYDAWGRLLSVKNASGFTISDASHIANVNPIRYRGYFYDTETKLYYCNSRYYDPQVKRFINADELLSTGTGFLGYNMFAYCENKPVMCSDPSGNRFEGLKEFGSRFVHTVKFFGRVIASPFKAISIEASGGIGIGAKSKVNFNGVPVEFGASTSITDSISYDKGEFDVKNKTSTTVGVEVAEVFDFAHTNGHEHSYFDDNCTCDFMDSSFGEKSECPANQKNNSNNASFGISVGAYLLFGGEISIGIDFETWGNELLSIFYDAFSYGK